MFLTSNFSSDQINSSCLNSTGGYKRIAPFIRCLYRITASKRFIRIVGIQNLFEFSICFRISKPATCNIQHRVCCYTRFNSAVLDHKVIIHINIAADSGDATLTAVLMERTRIIRVSTPIGKPLDVFFQQIMIIPIPVVINVEINTRLITKRFNSFTERLGMCITFRLSKRHTRSLCFCNRVILKVEEHDCVLTKSGFLNVFDTDPCFLLCLFNIECIRKVVHTHNGEPHFFALPYIFKESGIYCLSVTLSENYKLDPAILNLPGIDISLPYRYINSFLFCRH